MPNETDIAIIGAGLAGTYCAHLLSLTNSSIVLLEKSRGTGGRASSTRLTTNASCDLGAPYFQLTSSAWQTEIQKWTLANIISIDSDNLCTNQSIIERGKTLCYGKPTMSSLSRYLLGTIPILTQTRVHHIHKTENGWLLRDEKYRAIIRSKIVVITAPAAQASQLLATTCCKSHWLVSAQQAANACQAQWSVLIAQQAGDRNCVISDFVGFDPSIISKVIHDSGKQDRTHSNHWVIHANLTWSTNNADMEADKVAQILLQELFQTTGLKKINALFSVAKTHRWFFARHPETEKQSEPYLWDSAIQLGLAGDWLCQGDVEGALNSAKALSKAIKDCQK